MCNRWLWHDREFTEEEGGFTLRIYPRRKEGKNLAKVHQPESIVKKRERKLPRKKNTWVFTMWGGKVVLMDIGAERSWDLATCWPAGWHRSSDELIGSSGKMGEEVTVLKMGGAVIWRVWGWQFVHLKKKGILRVKLCNFTSTLCHNLIIHSKKKYLNLPSRNVDRFGVTKKVYYYLLSYVILHIPHKLW